MHKISFSVGNKSVIMSLISKKVFISTDFYDFEGGVIFKDGKIYILTELAKKMAPTLNYKILSNIILIDPGHGGGKTKENLGAEIFYNGKKIYEKDLVLNFSKKLTEELRKKNFRVVSTRKIDKEVSLDERVSLANNLDAEIFISIHINKYEDKSISGFETFYLSDETDDRYEKEIAKLENGYFKFSVTSDDTTDNIINSLLYNNKIEESAKLAKEITKNVKDFKEVRPIKKAPIYVLRRVMMPSVLIELGFMSNESELSNLMNEEYLKNLAVYVSNGINDFINK